MELPTANIGIKARNPQILTLFGQSKIGKSTLLSQLPDCLIIDTEKGSRFIDGLIVQAESLADLSNILKELKTGKYSYRYIALDTIDKIVEWCEVKVIQEYNAEQKAKGLKLSISDVGELAYGLGYSLVRTQVMKIIFAFKNLEIPLILIGHRRKSQIGEDQVEVSASSLDITGKLKNMICAESDAIGYLFRDNGNVMVSFKTSDELEVGSRCAHLRGKVFEFDWTNIFID